MLSNVRCISCTSSCKMVTVGQTYYNTLFLFIYNFLSSLTPEPQLQFVNNLQAIGIKEFVESNGYQFYEYVVTTSDGYLLSLFRIASGTNGNVTFSNNRPPVLLMHGIASSAYDFVIGGPEESFVYLLVDQGYDVWLGNCRGNRYSRKHVRLNPEEHDFWRFSVLVNAEHFSFHENGYYDIPTMVDFIINETNHKSIYYIGYSQGATSMFVTASERPEYIKKIRLFVALAPVVHSKAIQALLPKIIAQFYNQLHWFVSTYHFSEMLGRTETIIKTVLLWCGPEMPFSRMCALFISVNFGYSQELHSISWNEFIYSTPAGASIYQILHYIQGKLSDVFRQYDHGWMMNYIKYGKSTPPEYNLQTNIPTALIYGENDWMSTVEDIHRLSSKLKNIKLKFKTRFNHVDYFWAPKIWKFVFKTMEEN